MILDIVLSIVVTFGSGGLTGDFGECPPADQTEVVATSQETSTTTAVKQTKK